MSVALAVVAPVSVAALGNPNAAVGVIKPVNEQATYDGYGRYAGMLTKLIDP